MADSSAKIADVTPEVEKKEESVPEVASASSPAPAPMAEEPKAEEVKAEAPECKSPSWGIWTNFVFYLSTDVLS